MQTLRDHRTGDLFDPWSHLGPQRRRLLDNGWAGVFRDHLLQHLPVDELAPSFSHGLGRPSKDLHVALGILILQQLHDLTDQQTTEAVALNIAWHYALDIRSAADAYLCERTLRNYRRKVVDSGLEEVLFRMLTDRLIEDLDVDCSKQRLDSTAVRSAIRGLTRLGILVETAAKFLRELKRLLPEDYDSVDPEVRRKYLERRGDGCFASTRPSESRRRLPEAARDVYVLVEQFKGTAAEAMDSFGLLQQVFAEQCEVVANEEPVVVVRPPMKSGCDNVISPADPDARYNKHRGTGYLIQVMETYETDKESEAEHGPAVPDLITHVAVGKMNAHDKDALEPALTDVIARGAAPKIVLADTHSGSDENVAEAHQHGVEIVAPATTAKGKLQGRLTLEDFELDDEGRVLKCPGGHEPIETSVAQVRIQAVFAKEVCSRCKRSQVCPAAAVGRTSQRWQYTHDRVRNRQRRLRESSEKFRDCYRWRAGVEATMSRLKYQMGLHRLRVRGMASVAYVARLRALGLNIWRVAAYRATLSAA